MRTPIKGRMANRELRAKYHQYKADCAKLRAECEALQAKVYELSTKPPALALTLDESTRAMQTLIAQKDAEVDKLRAALDLALRGYCAKARRLAGMEVE